MIMKVSSSVGDLHSKILCSFWENLAKSYVGAPPGELAPPPQGNPGSATDHIGIADPMCLNYDVKWSQK